MKQKWVSLALLPLVMFVFAPDVKSQGKHPTPTKEDLRVRAYLSTFTKLELAHYVEPRNEQERKSQYYQAYLSQQDLKRLVDTFYLSPSSLQKMPTPGNPTQVFTLRFMDAPGDAQGLRAPYFSISVEKDKSRVGVFQDSRTGDVWAQPKQRIIHPTTVKRWMEILLAHPRIGPILQGRMSLRTPTPDRGGLVATPIKLEAAPGSEAGIAELEKELNKRIITVQGERVVPAGGEIPLWQLSKVIDSERQVNRFSINWYESVFQWRRSASVHYDRKKGVLIEHYEDGDESGASSTNCIYTRVTDQALHKLARTVSQTNGVTFSGLTAFGCTRSENKKVHSLLTPEN